MGSMYNPLIHSICAHFSIIIFSVFQKMQSVHQQGLLHCRFPHWHSHAANCYTSANVNKVPRIRVCDREHLGQSWEDPTTNNCYLDMSHSNGGSLFLGTSFTLSIFQSSNNMESASSHPLKFGEGIPAETPALRKPRTKMVKSNWSLCDLQIRDLQIHSTHES